MSVAAVIPARNEAGAVAELVRDLLGRVDIVVVADNGSTDATAQVASAAGALVVPEPRAGYGYACAAGAAAAVDAGAEVLVFIDGDGSSLAAEVSALVDPVRSGDADLVLGSRTLGTIEPGAMPAHQRFGNRLSSIVFRALYKRNITDLGPYRAIRTDLFTHLRLTEMTFGWPTEMMVKATTAGAVLLEVPVTWAPRVAGRSKVSGTVVGSIKAAWYILGVTMRGRTAKMRVPDFERTY